MKWIKENILILILIGIVLFLVFKQPVDNPPPVVNNDSIYHVIDSTYNRRFEELKSEIESVKENERKLKNEIIRTHTNYTLSDAYAWLDRFRAKHPRGKN